MRNKILLLGVLASFLTIGMANANERSRFDYTFFSGGMNYSIVSCDYAQAQALLDMFGAKDADIYCSGGISASGYSFPLSMTIEYTAPAVGTTTVTKNLKSDSFNPVCDFNVDLIDRMVKKFSNVKVLKSNSGCMSPDSPFSYQFEITLAQ